MKYEVKYLTVGNEILTTEVEAEDEESAESTAWDDDYMSCWDEGIKEILEVHGL